MPKCRYPTCQCVEKSLAKDTEDVDDIDIAFLFELVERRYAAKSTVLCTQYTPAEWHGRLGGGVQADALVDRLVHGAIRIDLGDVNVRKLLSEKK